MKYFRAILIVSLIFIFPGISYLYLRYGFMYRKEALEILSEQVDFTSTQLSYLADFDTNFLTSIKTGVNLFQLVSDEQDEKDLYFLANNFKKRNDFSIFALYDNFQLTSLTDTIYSNVLNRLYDEAKSPEDFMQDSRFMLSKESKIRKVYGFTEEDMKTAYEHTVILLPMKKREKIKLIRDKEI